MRLSLEKIFVFGAKEFSCICYSFSLYLKYDSEEVKNIRSIEN